LFVPDIQNTWFPLLVLEGFHLGPFGNQIVSVKVRAFNVIIRYGFTYTVLLDLWIMMGKVFWNLPSLLVVLDGVARRDMEIVRGNILTESTCRNTIGCRIGSGFLACKRI
jgi:hypothetical protein